MSTTRQEEMRQQCIAFHKEHPEVWDMFVRYTLTMIERGYKNYSAQSVVERIRWEKDAGGDGINNFKINNNFTAFYSRRFMRMYPEYDGFFRTRRQLSGEEDATGLSPLRPTDYE